MERLQSLQPMLPPGVSPLEPERAQGQTLAHRIATVGERHAVHQASGSTSLEAGEGVGGAEALLHCLRWTGPCQMEPNDCHHWRAAREHSVTTT